MYHGIAIAFVVLVVGLFARSHNFMRIFVQLMNDNVNDLVTTGCTLYEHTRTPTNTSASAQMPKVLE